jgi:catechol 2,3-dioxygenase-like lactoylglutathione lyase family enzyme
MSGGLSWGHINVNVRDLDQSIAFYRQLGFDVFMSGIPYLDLTADAHADLSVGTANALGLAPGSRARACIMQLGNGFPKLDLTELANGEPRPPLANADLGLVRLCLACSDLQAEYARLTDLGVRFLAPPQPGHEGLADVAVCADPDGTLIELIQIYPEKWQRSWTNSAGAPS